MSLLGSYLWNALWFLAALAPLIFLHEMGHYLVGRWCGIKADVFAIGFGREVFGWTDKRGTRWKLCWLPLGGYVRFAGDLSEAGGDNDEWRKLPEAEQALTFQSKPVWKRALTVAAGPITNMLVAVVIFAGIIAVYGNSRVSTVVGRIEPKSVAETVGFKPGDRIAAINGREMKDFGDIQDYVSMRPQQMMTFSLVRGGSPFELLAAPAKVELVSRFGTKMTIGRLGMGPSAIEIYHPAWWEIPGAAIDLTWRQLRNMVDGIGQIIMGYHSPKELGGPGMIAKLAGDFATAGGASFIFFVALISINLGFINLLPVPMLDGGHLFFYAIEAIRRKPVGLAAQEWAYRIGFMLVVSLMVFATFNDFVRFGFLG